MDRKEILRIEIQSNYTARKVKTKQCTSAQLALYSIGQILQQRLIFSGYSSVCT